MESPFFFKNGADDVFGVLHTPDNEAAQAGLVLCHAFGEEKLWSHRVHVNLAREAVHRGFAALRFDFRGHGDSSLRSEDCSIQNYFSDIDSGITALRSECPTVKNIGLVGLRFGASLALMYAAHNKEIKRLALWEPIVQGRRYMQELLRINLSTQLAVYGSIQRNREALVQQMRAGSHANVDGYLISNEFYEECNEIDCLEIELANPLVEILVAQIAPDIKQKDRVELRNLAAQYEKAEFLKVAEPPFWREIKPFTSRTNNLIRETLDWWERLNAG